MSRQLDRSVQQRQSARVQFRSGKSCPSTATDGLHSSPAELISGHNRFDRKRLGNNEHCFPPNKLSTPIYKNFVDNNVSPVGRFRDRLDFWKVLTDNQFILNIIENGYYIPFISKPKETFIRNNRSSIANDSFVMTEIRKLVKLGCVVELDSKPLVVNPLTVVTGKNDKKRMVLDCRHLNENIAKFNFRYEDCRVAERLIQKNDYMISYDVHCTRSLSSLVH